MKGIKMKDKGLELLKESIINNEYLKEINIQGKYIFK
jgi:hypothetical protein